MQLKGRTVLFKRMGLPHLSCTFQSQNFCPDQVLSPKMFYRLITSKLFLHIEVLIKTFKGKGGSKTPSGLTGVEVSPLIKAKL